MRLSADRSALTTDQFSALMAPFCPFEARPLLAAGVSGGRDSLALILLADEWARTRGGRAIAVIVDHGLRAASAGEAKATRELLARHDIEAEVVRWTGAKPAKAIQQVARAERYRLLFEFCARRGILHLLVAHQADDQAETIAMRGVRHSGPDGMAGMAAQVEHRSARLLRPLLSVTRQCLTATLQARGIAWIDDPSNDDPRFERARLRAAGPLAAVAAGAGEGRAERERLLAHAAVGVLELDAEGAVAIDRSGLRALDRDHRVRLLSRVVQGVGGRDYPPRRDRLQRATERLLQGEGRGKSGKGRDFTLSECRLMLRQNGPKGRLRWIVRAENGTNRTKEGRQPLIPAGFFACGAAPPPHLDCQPLPGPQPREPVQS